MQRFHIINDTGDLICLINAPEALEKGRHYQRRTVCLPRSKTHNQTYELLSEPSLCG